MIQAYSNSGKYQQALRLYDEMALTGIILDEYTYSIILKILAELTDLEKGQIIYTQLKVISNFVEMRKIFNSIYSDNILVFQEV